MSMPRELRFDPLQVLYEDNHCLAVAKPAPLLTQGPAHVPNLEAMAKAYLAERYHKKGRVYLGIPHRLDRPVSGVVVFARATKSAQRLAEQFRLRQVRKIYWAFLDFDQGGRPAPKTGKWEDWLLKKPDEAKAELTTADSPGARQALLSLRRLQVEADGALVEFEPLTGRMHQIRVQAASRGWPIRGDALYGSRLPFGGQPEFARDRIIALHGRSLTFLHPIRYEPITVTAPLPGVWSSVLRSGEPERTQ
jgi:23S rRNA pseudouridine1911/1915/1917 synthase